MSDEQFLQRVYRSSFWWSLLVLSYLLLSQLLSAAAGFTIGVAMGLAVLRTIEAIVGFLVTPDRPVLVKGTMPMVWVAKYAVLGVCIYFIVRSGWISLPAFAWGVGVPSAMMFMKTLAHFFSEIEFDPFWGSSLEPERIKHQA